MSDRILAGFIDAQERDARRLFGDSCLVDVARVDESRFVVELACRGLVRQTDGAINEHEGFVIGIAFPDNYLRGGDPHLPTKVVTLLAPPNVWHPNINFPGFCVGHIVPGSPLTSLICQAADIISYRNVTMREDDALNPAACSWARQNVHRFPVDDRPLRPRRLQLKVRTVGEEVTS